MKCRKKTLSRTEWKRVTERQDVYMPIKNELFSGMAGLLYLRSVREPLYVTYPKEYGGFPDGKVKIADNGYYWMQIAPQDCHWWLTIMFDNNGMLLQSYFDMTRENNVSNTRDAYFWDLFLDVAIPAQGEPVILDRDELDDALRDGTITQKEHQSAIETAVKIIDWYRGHTDAYHTYIDTLFTALRAHL